MYQAAATSGDQPVHVFPVVEFRQYRLHPGMRGTLISLFEEKFIESQEECGMAVLGQFRDLDDRDRFTWLRGFASMQDRPRALSLFYEGPVWAEHRDAANATMINSDDVHLLQPADGSGGLPLDAASRPAPGSQDASQPVYVALLCTPATGNERSFREMAARLVPSMLTGAGGQAVATLATLGAANNWPRLPVHENRTVVMWLVRFTDGSAADEAIARLSKDRRWRKAAADLLAAPAEFRRLVPTRRSAMR